MSDMYACEREALGLGYNSIAGVDEAGRGPLAGPVVAAAVIFRGLPENPGIKDSKALTPKRRSDLVFHIYTLAESVTVGIVWPEEIDTLNIHASSLLAMKRAVCELLPQPDFILVDGIHPISTAIPQKTVKSGDSLSISIAAASIIAKTARDRIMEAYHKVYPDYDFAVHKGYPTVAHREILKTIGPSPIHRLTFRGVLKET